MPPVEFEPIISTGERPQTYALDREATGMGHLHPYETIIWWTWHVTRMEEGRDVYNILVEAP